MRRQNHRVFGVACSLRPGRQWDCQIQGDCQLDNAPLRCSRTGQYNALVSFLV